MEKSLEIVQFGLEKLVGIKCATKLIQTNLTDLDCLKLLISKALGVGILLGGVFLKLPQIAKIITAGSVKGISLPSYLLETMAFTIGLAYNVRQANPFSTYGEGVFITIQNVIILALILYYGGSKLGLVIFLLGYSALAWSLFDVAIISKDLLLFLQGTTIFIGVASRLPQIFSIFKSKTTGQLSAITIFLQFIGSAARIYTTLQEVNDKVILAGFLISTFLNGVLAYQMVVYGWGSNQASTISAKNRKEIKKVQ